ncbi:MAG TPA: choice-of-anchor tandem repeat NxxGxxAF-containing protein [Acidobacteriota bacterium]|jgi:hypothetical protein
MKKKTCLLVFVLFIVRFEFLRAQTYTLRPIVLQGQSAPGTHGTFASLFFPSPYLAPLCLNDSGEMAFKATISGGSTSSGVFRFSQGVISPIAFQGQPAPGAQGGLFAEFFSIKMNHSGDIAFTASISGSAVTSGLFQVTQGTMMPIALQGQPAPGTQDRNFGDISPAIAMNDSGDIAFSATLTDSGVGLFMYSQGRILPIAFSGQIIAGTLTLDTFWVSSINDSRSIAFLSASGSSQNFVAAGYAPLGSLFLFADGVISFVASPTRSLGIEYLIPSALSSQDTIVFLEIGSAGGAGGGGLAGRALSLYSNGTVTPIDGILPLPLGTPPSLPSMNRTGSFAFSATIRRGNTSLGDLGVFLHSAGSLSPIALNGQIAPDTGGLRFFNFGSVSLNDSSQVAFVGSFLLNSFSSPAPQGVYLSSDRGITKIAMADPAGDAVGNILPDEAPGTGGGRFSGFALLCLNNRNSISFYAAVVGGTTNTGIFIATPSEQQGFRSRRRP